MPWISRILDWLMIDALRGPCLAASSAARNLCGVRFHPAVFQMTGALLIVAGAYWVYVFVRGARG